MSHPEVAISWAQKGSFLRRCHGLAHQDCVIWHTLQGKMHTMPPSELQVWVNPWVLLWVHSMGPVCVCNPPALGRIGPYHHHMPSIQHAMCGPLCLPLATLLRVHPRIAMARLGCPTRLNVWPVTSSGLHVHCQTSHSARTPCMVVHHQG